MISTEMVGVRTVEEPEGRRSLRRQRGGELRRSRWIGSPRQSLRDKGALVVPMGWKAKVESWACRLEDELRDPHARVELMTGKVDL